MEQVIKVFMAVFSIIMLSMIGLGVISSMITIHEAVTFKSDVIKEIENSNYSETVITKCKEQAVSQGFELEVNVMQYDADNKYTMAEVIVKYNFTVPILSIEKEHQTSGYAR